MGVKLMWNIAEKSKQCSGRIKISENEESLKSNAIPFCWDGVVLINMCN